MESPRRSGGICTRVPEPYTTVPSILISPPVGFSSPPMALSVVVLPHPKGPRRVRGPPAAPEERPPRPPRHPRHQEGDGKSHGRRPRLHEGHGRGQLRARGEPRFHDGGLHGL